MPCTAISRRPAGYPGFTLTELLVVIAVLMLLAGLLLPVVSVARDRAWRATCTSNLHQLSMAFQQYMDDYDRAFPPNTQGQVRSPEQIPDLWLWQIRPYVRGDGVTRTGNRYTLSERKEAYYYHPMPVDKRYPDGDYELSPSVDGRFWSKMDFEERPTDTVALESTIVLTEENGSFRMDIEVDGPGDVNVILEFRFRKGGKLEGVTPGEEDDDSFLKSGSAKYTFGDDVIEIGPGKYEHNNLRGLDGEVYSTHFGTIKGEGMHVYLTGITPFSHSLTIK